MTKQQQLALGRIFRLMSRPFQEGDIQEYEAARIAALEGVEDPQPEYQPCWPRDRFLACSPSQS